tara:strand:- start:2392 stop:2607 length:216 start_codon:yes stop_codon:yes gene_type:complete
VYIRIHTKTSWNAYPNFKKAFLKSHLILKDGEEESITKIAKESITKIAKESITETTKESVTKTTLTVASTR